MPDSAIEVILAITIGAGVFLLIAMQALRCQIAYSLGIDDGETNTTPRDGYDFDFLQAYYYRVGRRRGRMTYQRRQQQKESSP